MPDVIFPSARRENAVDRLPRVLLALQRRLASAARLLVALFALNGALQMLSWLFDLYSESMSIGHRFSIAQALILLLAALWDVAMWGEAITNRHSRVFPRHSRVSCSSAT